MKNEYYKVDLEQIYNFICEIPDFNYESNSNKIKVFFTTIQDKIQYKNIKSLPDNDFTIIINGHEVLFNILEAPKFLNKKMFINWVVNKIK